MTDGICDLARRDCTREATHDVHIVDPDDADWNLDRECCDAHRGWFRTTFTDRGYDVTLEARP